MHDSKNAMHIAKQLKRRITMNDSLQSRIEYFILSDEIL